MSSTVRPNAQPTILRGRARGLDALFRLRDAAVRGRGGTVIVHGETGTGRATLLAAVAAAGADEFTVLTTRGYEPERSLRRAGLHRLLQPMLARLTRREVASLEAASGANPPTIGRAGYCGACPRRRANGRCCAVSTTPIGSTRTASRCSPGCHAGSTTSRSRWC